MYVTTTSAHYVLANQANTQKNHLRPAFCPDLKPSIASSQAKRLIYPLYSQASGITAGTVRLCNLNAPFPVLLSFHAYAATASCLGPVLVPPLTGLSFGASAVADADAAAAAAARFSSSLLLS
jgi:hypothetical protein